MESELEDINEIVEEKIQAKTKKKRESNERLEEATKIHHDELLLTESYLRAFLLMKGLYLKEP